MHSKNPLIALVVALFVVCAAASPQFALSSIFYQNDSAQDQKSATKDSQPASSEPSKPAAADLKPASSDEGQLATVNNAKIPAYAKVYVAPMLGDRKSTRLNSSH